MAGTPLPDGRAPILLTAHADDLIAQDAAAILDYLGRRPHITDVTAVAATLRRTRRVRRHRAVIRAADRGELVEALASLASTSSTSSVPSTSSTSVGADHRLVTRANPRPQTGGPGRIAFVFPGQGSQWPSMGVEAYARLEEYRAEVDTCTAEFTARGLASPLDYLLADPGAQTNDFSQVQIQGAQFVHGVALARVWRACGVLPDITVGHSLGEIGAAYVAGAITLAAAVGVVGARATLLDTLTGPYRVAVLGVTPDEARDVIAATTGWVELSVVNSPSSVAISGETAAVAAAVRDVAARGVFAREIEMWFPAHTTALDPLRAELDAMLPSGEFTETPVQFIGSSTASVVPAGTDFAGYWYDNLRSTVRFDRAVGAALECGATTFVELSAHPALLFAMADVLDASPGQGRVVMVGSGRRDEPLVDRLSANVMTVALADPAYRPSDAGDDGVGTLRDFPFAPMRAEHHWAAREPLPSVAGLTVAVEGWEACELMAAPASRTVAVLDLGGDGSADALRGALARHDGAAMTEAARADLLVVVAPAIDDDDPVTASQRLADAVDAGLLRYSDAIGADTRDVWLVTVRAERVTGTDPQTLPAQAALAAMHRSVGFEHPDQAFSHLDVPDRLSGPTLAAAAADVILGAARDAAVNVALRAGQALHRRIVDEEPVPAPPWPAGALDEVLITGGAGAVGLHFARSLVERGARRLVLLSRSGVDAGRIAELAAGHQVEIVAPRCDITDPAQVAAAAAEFATAGASLVVHAAGAAAIAPAADLTGAAVRESCSAKITGIDVVSSTWPLRDDARLLLCSSVSGLWGGSGHAAYAAANRLLDVAAERLRASGRTCTSVRWGLWPGNGVIDAAEVARVERAGLSAMVPERAVDAALRDRRDHAVDPVIFTADSDRLSLFLGGEVAAAPVTTTHVVVAEADPADVGGIAAADAVRAALGAVLKLADTSDIAALDFDASLLDLGVDSLLAIDLRKKLKTATGQNVPLATILGGATANEIIERLEDSGNRARIRD